MLLIDKMITVHRLHKNGKLCMYVCVCLQSAQFFVMHMGPRPQMQLTYYYVYSLSH